MQRGVVPIVRPALGSEIGLIQVCAPTTAATAYQYVPFFSAVSVQVVAVIPVAASLKPVVAEVVDR